MREKMNLLTKNYFYKKYRGAPRVLKGTLIELGIWGYLHSTMACYTLRVFLHGFSGLGSFLIAVSNP